MPAKRTSGSETPGRTRGRPALSASQVADMRSHISGCALKLFQEFGYGAVSMRRLAEEAGCTPMTIYRYFEGKIDILRALWAEVFAELFDGLDRIAAAEADPIERLNAVALGYVAYWQDHREHYFMVFMSSGITDADVSLFVGGEPVVGRFNLFRECLAGALGPGTAPEEIELKGQLLLCILNGIGQNLMTISAYPWAPPKTLVRAAVATLVSSAGAAP